MKKIAFILVLVMAILSFASCDVIFPDGLFGDEQGSNDKTDTDGVDDDDTNDGEDDNDDSGVDNGNTDNGNDSEDKEDPDADKNAALIDITELVGLNEQIFGEFTAFDGYEYKVSYKKSEDTEYKTLESELIFRTLGRLEFYILGISSGKYDIKIEAEKNSSLARRTIKEIEVSAQDRSGYAHFGHGEGIGAYNNDGTVKDGTTILYVTNENKNTITMTIDGKEYVGLVDILQKQYLSDTPLLIRVIGRISTNQWNYKNSAPRLTDGSNWSNDYFDNTFSTEYGENLVGLKVRYTDKCAGKTYTYGTTADGLGEVRVGGSGISTTTYNGKTVYDDDSFINVIEVQAASNITIEGIGNDAEFFQFGIGFEECSSIEIKNLTFTNYPEDALNFMVGSDKGVEAYGNYWVHNNTFNKGYNAWDVTGERDKGAGDGTIDMAYVHNVTVAYNKFDSCKKTMLVGNGDSVKCMNISLHHNYFLNVGSRLPLTRAANVHSYNNYFSGCSSCASVRVNSYVFSEANYYNSCGKPFDIKLGAVKSYGDIFVSSSSGSATIVSTRDQKVSNSCKPNGKDYSSFDTDHTLFYYDAERGITDADYLISADLVPEFVEKHAGAGVMERLEITD